MHIHTLVFLWVMIASIMYFFEWLLYYSCISLSNHCFNHIFFLLAYMHIYTDVHACAYTLTHMCMYTAVRLLNMLTLTHAYSPHTSTEMAGTEEGLALWSQDEETMAVYACSLSTLLWDFCYFVLTSIRNGIFIITSSKMALIILSWQMVFIIFSWKVIYFFGGKGVLFGRWF